MRSHDPGQEAAAHVVAGGSNGMERMALSLAAEPASAAAARAAMTSALTGHVTAGLLADARLLVSELVSNSVRHAGLADDDVIRVGAVMADGMLRVEVDDAGTTGTVAVRARTADGDLGGFGLAVVDALAHRWGVVRDGGTQVWAELACARATG